jgi:hypothetical protein
MLLHRISARIAIRLLKVGLAHARTVLRRSAGLRVAIAAMPCSIGSRLVVR